MFCELSDKFVACMLIGHRFKQKWWNEETEDWSACEECATVVEVTYTLMETLNISMEKALDFVMETVMESGFRKHIGCTQEDSTVKGFLAGEILGLPARENTKLAEKALDIWNADREGRYGYFQEVLEKVKEEAE